MKSTKRKPVWVRLLCGLAVLCGLLLAACRPAGESKETGMTETETVPNGRTEKETETAGEPVDRFTALTVAGNPISDYRIVYAQDSTRLAKESIRGGDLIADCDFDRQSAERLRDMLEAVSGVRLEVVCDMDTDSAEHEITVGMTSRSATYTVCSGLSTDGYRIMTVKSTLAVCGETYGNTWHAMDALEAHLRDALAKGKAIYDLSADFRLDGTYRLTRIGCIGDSITVGWNEDYYNYDYLTYPKQLGYLFWRDAVVINYGEGGREMRTDAGNAYTKSEIWKTCLKDAAGLDVVTVMLGTNDARYIRNDQWDAYSDGMFKASAQTIAEALRRKNPDMKILFLSSPEIFEERDGTVGGAIRAIVGSQKGIPEFLEAKGLTVDFFDMNALLQNAEYTKPDGIHLTVEGLAYFARQLAPVIEKTYLAH